jgi:uncharacterized protein (TIGR02271 family)
MAKTVIGLYDNFSEAQEVVRDLVDAGFDRDQISIVASDREGKYANELDRERAEKDKDTSGAATGAVTGGVIGAIAGVVLGLGALAIPGIGPAIAAGPIISGLVGAGIGAAGGGILGALIDMGVPEEDAGYYAEGVRRGGTIVTVNTPDHLANDAIAVMNRHNPVDIEKRAAQWRQEGWTGYEAEAKAHAAATTERTGAERHYAPETHKTVVGAEGETKVPVMEEEIRVGKRQVEHGGVRMHAFVERQPVEEQVRLRQERVDVERRPVDRPISEADLKAFEEGTYEFTEKGEEAVVDKRARVIEEVVVKKGVEEHTETVRDTVRRTKVDVERTGEEHAGRFEGFDAHRTNFQQHFKTNFSSAGGVYTDYEPAYRFGHNLSSDASYRGRRWEDIEPEVRQRWELEHKEKGSWEKFKDAVRYGWNKL